MHATAIRGRDAHMHPPVPRGLRLRVRLERSELDLALGSEEALSVPPPHLLCVGQADARVYGYTRSLSGGFRHLYILVVFDPDTAHPEPSLTLG
jgi:hypothetical protein